MKILFENADWLAIEKPCGISTHAAWLGDLGVVEWLRLHKSRKVYVCSRLDRDTSGVLLFALSAAASGRAQTIHEAESSKKEYLFLSLHEKRDSAEWDIDSPLDSFPAKTHFTYLRRHGRFFVYKATIHRGRKHQIRRHAAQAGIPVLGDVEYGGGEYARLCLHCQKVYWPEIGHAIDATSPSFLDHELLEFDPGLAASLDRRRGCFADVTNAFRVLHRGEIKRDLSVDKYGPFLQAWFYEEDGELEELVQCVQPILETLMRRYGADGCVIKRPQRNPHNNKLITEEVILGLPPPDEIWVREHDLKYRITLSGSQHVGLFLDQRDNRRRVWNTARERTVANLFAYSCSFSVVAAAAGADVVFSVDVADSALEVGKINFSANGLTESRRGKFIRDDVRRWLERRVRQQLESPSSRPCDLVIVDPPTFSTTQEIGVFQVEKEWPSLAKSVAELMAGKGVALFSTNHRAGDVRFYHEILSKEFPVVERLSAPLDFPEPSGEPLHVKMFVCGSEQLVKGFLT